MNIEEEEVQYSSCTRNPLGIFVELLLLNRKVDCAIVLET